MRSIGCILAVSLLATSIACSHQESDNNDEVKAQLEYKFAGLINVKANYNETKTDDKLVLSKSYIKLAFTSYLWSYDKAPKFKLSMHKELVGCNNLQLLQQSRRESISCLSVEEHLAGDDFNSISTDETQEGVKRTARLSVRTSVKSFLQTSKQNLLLYPLKQESVQDEVEGLLNRAELDTPNFQEPLNLQGFYFEIPSEVMPCSGDIYFMANSTRQILREATDGYPEVLDQINHAFHEAIENGFLFAIKDLECRLKSTGFKLVSDFLVIAKRDFPFFTVRHKIYSTPLPLFVDYDAKIDQVWNGTKLNTNVVLSYNTILNPLMSYNLRQTYVWENDTTGGEQMALVFRSGIASMVDAAWSEHEFVKTFVLGVIDRSKTLQVFQDILGLSFTSDQEETAIAFFVKKNARQIIESTIESYLDKPVDSDYLEHLDAIFSQL